jgi:hypothetical protein
MMMKCRNDETTDFRLTMELWTIQFLLYSSTHSALYIFCILLSSFLACAAACVLALLCTHKQWVIMHRQSTVQSLTDSVVSSKQKKNGWKTTTESSKDFIFRQTGGCARKTAAHQVENTALIFCCRSCPKLGLRTLPWSKEKTANTKHFVNCLLTWCSL